MAGRAPFSSSSSFSYGWKYDVFLNFRGEDNRFDFVGYLYKALNDKGFNTFLDDEKLEGGDEITSSLRKAIKESRIAIPIFTQNYASSSFCLDELVDIICCNKAEGRLVLPVFYKVDPSDVRYQRGSYGEALAKHEEWFSNYDKEKLEDNMERLKKWKMALKKAAGLSGEHFKLRNEYEHEFIGKIVKVVSNKINRAPLHVADYPVGLESRVLEVNSLLDVGSDDVVHMVGIHGIGGIGKTTLALAVYNLIADSFDGSCFLGSVRENSMKHGLVHLQEMLLSKIVGEKDIKLGDVCEGFSIIKHRLHMKKVLLILDDVDKLKQLQAMVGGPDWFGPGSRVIITTRDKHLLASHGVERTYELDGLNMREAIELLNWKAFRAKKVDQSYVHILNRVVTYASQLPLALEIIGSNLFGKSVEEWESALVQYKRIPNKEIQKILKVSFDALEEDVQKIFLDIACFFNEYVLAEVEDILCAHYGVCVKYGIRVLVEKSLIKIDYGHVTLHDLLQDMGREIVRQESPEKPEKRSRLWLLEDIVQVLEDNTGTCKTQIIILDFPKSKEEVELDGQAFKEMKSLKTLIIRNGHFSQSPKHLPNSLRVLEWWGYPSQSLPYDFHPKKLVIFKLPRSCLMSLKLPERKKFVNLTVLNVNCNDCMSQIPDVSGIPNLVELSFRYCDNLIKIHESVGFLDKLRILDANGCKKLRTFPPINLTSLEELYLSYCSSLESFPEILGKMENITDLYIWYTPIKELPFSIRNLTQLQTIDLEHCGMIQLPSSIVMLPELERLIVEECEGLQLSKLDEGEGQVSSTISSNMEHFDLKDCNIPDEFFPNVLLTCFANVKNLNLSFSNFTVLPACIKECHFLRELNLDYCNNLREIRGVPPNIETLSARNCKSLTSLSRSMLRNEKLHREGGDKTEIPNWLEYYSRGEPISFWFRNKLPSISLCLATENLMCGFGKLVTKLIVNGDKEFIIDEGHTFSSSIPFGYHIFFFNKEQIKFEDVDEVLLENEWNHVVVSYENIGKFNMKQIVAQMGVHIFKQKSSMEDIRFANTWEKVIKHVETMVSHIQFMPQQQNLALLEPRVEQGREWLPVLPPPAMKSLNDNVNCDPNSMASTRISSSTSVQGCKIASRKRKIDALRLDLDNEVNEPFCHAPSKVVLYSDSTTSRLASNGGLQEKQYLTSIIQQSFEGFENVNEAKGKGTVACNSNDGEDNVRSPLLELLPKTEVTSDKKQHASRDESMNWDPMELEYQVAYPKHHLG